MTKVCKELDLLWTSRRWRMDVMLGRRKTPMLSVPNHWTSSEGIWFTTKWNQIQPWHSRKIVHSSPWLLDVKYLWIKAVFVIQAVLYGLLPCLIAQSASKNYRNSSPYTNTNVHYENFVTVEFENKEFTRNPVYILKLKLKCPKRTFSQIFSTVLAVKSTWGWRPPVGSVLVPLVDELRNRFANPSLAIVDTFLIAQKSTEWWVFEC